MRRKMESSELIQKTAKDIGLIATLVKTTTGRKRARHIK